MEKRITTEDFITRAKQVHGNKYDYSKVEYTRHDVKVIIICPTHGEFLQTPNNHLNKRGCPSCQDNKKLTTEEFITKSRSVHGDKYDYSNVVYRNTRTKVNIICPVHGNFDQIPNSHLQGRGCPKCSGVQKSSTEEFVVKAKMVHGNRYDYSKVVYINNKSKVIIVCPIHGEFEQTPHNHLQGNTCPKCVEQTKRLTTEEFISKAKKVHGSKYIYSNVVYTDTKTRVIITCPIHGNFEQSANIHLQGYGCSKCSSRLKYTYDKCYETAKKYEWLSDFMRLDKTCYEKSRKNNWLKDFTWLKRNYEKDENILTSQKHCIYKYKFPQFNSVYIGLTVDLNKRHKRGHSKDGSVYNFCKANNLDIPKPQIIESNLTVEESKIREGYWIDYYKKQGYSLLNRVKAGSVGALCSVRTGNETDEFIFKAKAIHGNRYNYEKVNYEHSHKKVTIICPIHGEYLQLPSNHLQGYGCRKCNTGGRNKKGVTKRK